MSKTWRHHLMRATGNGRVVPLLWDAPLSGVVVEDQLSGPGSIGFTVNPEHPNLDLSLFRSWSTVVVSEWDGRIVQAAIVTDHEPQGPELRVETVGLPGYLTDLAYTGNFQGIKVDPLDMVRRMWSHAQAQPSGDLGVQVDSTRSPVRIGEEVRQVDFTTGAGEDVSFEAGPYVLAWWKTSDMGKEVDDLAKSTPFDYRADYGWGDGDTLTTRLRLGYPRLGSRKHGLRFVVGENITELPKLTVEGNEYASEVLALGAGEGRDMRKGHEIGRTDRLRRTRVVVDKSQTSHKRAQSLAVRALAASLGDIDIAEITVRDHDNARLGSWRVGDEILVTLPDGWVSGRQLWVRVIGQRWETESDRVRLQVVRADKETFGDEQL